MVASLSERQQHIIEFIGQYQDENGYPPTIREIGKAVGITSTSVVKYNLERLKEKGCLNRSKEVSRGLHLPGQRKVVNVPKAGVIRAGEPKMSFGQQENIFGGETLALTQDLVTDPEQVYALQVKGDSMIDALVAEGDWVVVRHQPTAQRGDMIVAWIRDREETTLKYYHPEGPQVRLQPANPAYEPIYVASGDLEIQGKVIAIVRQIQ
jgi:repressor LexA